MWAVGTFAILENGKETSALCINRKIPQRSNVRTSYINSTLLPKNERKKKPRSFTNRT